jgi:indolepyruvate ferredoxin oxidoreductase alpha subunit
MGQRIRLEGTDPMDMNTHQALACAAADAGVDLITSYPGSPASGMVEAVIADAKQDGPWVDWSTNERLALETAIGASIGGRRSLVCVKSVGVNVMLDPLMCLNLTPVHGGLVILIGDDPGGYGSQNDQDTRLLAPMLEMPMLEPASPEEAYHLLRSAFEWSEHYETPFLIRITRSSSQFVGPVARQEKKGDATPLGLCQDRGRFVPVPSDVVARHQDLHSRLLRLSEWAERAPGNRASGGGDLGVIAAGAAFRKLQDVVDVEGGIGCRVLKLATVFPSPERLLCRFGEACRRVLVLEEQEPFLEERIAALYHRSGVEAQVLGRLSGHVHGREGELYRWMIQDALGRFLPEFEPSRSHLRDQEADERPHKEDHCAGSGYERIIDCLARAAAGRGEKLLLIADPGCMVALRERLTAKYAIGSAVGVADGLSRATREERPVAVIGDSAFFHSGLAALCNAARAGGRTMVVVLDNGGTRSTGGQPSPSSARDAFGRRALALSIPDLARACGVPHVYDFGIEAGPEALTAGFARALAHESLALVRVRL